MLGLAQRGLRDMADPELEFHRIMLGFFGVVVFGRSVTFALQHLRTFDEQAFNDWYAPWLAEMKADPLCRFFNDLRSAILHDVEPVIGIVRGSGRGSYDPTRGYIHTADTIPTGSVSLGFHPLPALHRGRPIESTDTRHLATLYVAYLDELLKSALPVVASVQTRWRAEHPWQTPESG